MFFLLDRIENATDFSDLAFDSSNCESFKSKRTAHFFNRGCHGSLKPGGNCRRRKRSGRPKQARTVSLHGRCMSVVVGRGGTTKMAARPPAPWPARRDPGLTRSTDRPGTRLARPPSQQRRLTSSASGPVLRADQPMPRRGGPTNPESRRRRRRRLRLQRRQRLRRSRKAR